MCGWGQKRVLTGAEGEREEVRGRAREPPKANKAPQGPGRGPKGVKGVDVAPPHRKGLVGAARGRLWREGPWRGGGVCVICESGEITAGRFLACPAVRRARAS